MKTRLLPYFSLALLGLALSATPAAAQLQWSPGSELDKGQQTAVAALPSGLVLEFHRTHAPTSYSLWYRVGQDDGRNLNWGGSQRLPADGSWPNVAITKEGNVLFVWSSGKYKSDSDLYYMVGKIDPDGDVNQSIIWLRPGKHFDSGFHSSTAINDNGVIVEAHESGSGGTGLYYRVGRFTNAAAGDFNIIWDSGSYGQHYDDGVNPHIAINDRNEVVEVHEVTDESLLHYHRGVVVSGGVIDFRPSQRYEDNGYSPSVALLDSGQVLALQAADNGIYSRTGTLSQSNPDLIDWSDSVKIAGQSGPTAIAANGTHPVGPEFAVGTWSGTHDSASRVYSSVAQIR